MFHRIGSDLLNDGCSISLSPTLGVSSKEIYILLSSDLQVKEYGVLDTLQNLHVKVGDFYIIAISTELSIHKDRVKFTISRVCEIQKLNNKKYNCRVGVEFTTPENAGLRADEIKFLINSISTLGCHDPLNNVNYHFRHY